MAAHSIVPLAPWAIRPLLPGGRRPGGRHEGVPPGSINAICVESSPRPVFPPEGFPMTPTPASGTVADAQKNNWLDRHAPEWLKPYGRLARWDRPIGFWLLFWPCAWGIGLAAIASPQAGFGWWAAVLMFLGSILM